MLLFPTGSNPSGVIHDGVSGPSIDNINVRSDTVPVFAARMTNLNSVSRATSYGVPTSLLPANRSPGGKDPEITEYEYVSVLVRSIGSCNSVTLRSEITPKLYKNYTTTTDTFNKVTG